MATRQTETTMDIDADTPLFAPAFSMRSDGAISMMEKRQANAMGRIICCPKYKMANISAPLTRL